MTSKPARASSSRPERQRRTRGRREAEPWTEDELTVALAACPTDVQNYDPRRPWVVELADLLGRSPGAISLRFANFFSLKKHGSAGFGHVSRLMRVVYERYVGREDDLYHDARQIRERLYDEVTSPRVEREVDANEREAMEAKLRALFPEARLPPNTIIVYSRRGSWWVGVLALVQLALLYPEETREVFRKAIEIMGRTARRSAPLELLLTEKQVALAEGDIRRRAPKFHPEELSEKDRITLALRLPTLKSLRTWKPLASRLELYVGASKDQERARVGAYFGIDAKRICDRCLLMLLEALEDALMRGTLA